MAEMRAEGHLRCHSETWDVSVSAAPHEITLLVARSLGMGDSQGKAGLMSHNQNDRFGRRRETLNTDRIPVHVRSKMLIAGIIRRHARRKRGTET
jgi:hypothetical protein